MRSVVFAGLLLFAAGLHASNPAAAPRDIVVAQVAPFSGPISLYSNATHLGASACFAAVNARGGIHGAKIRFITRDDRLDPVKTVAMFRETARNESPVAFLYPVGPAGIEALVAAKVPQTERVAVIGTIPPMYKLRSPVDSFMFHIGQGDDAEIAKIVEHIATLGFRSVGIVHWDDPALRDAVAIVDREAARRHLSVTTRLSSPSSGRNDIDALAARLVEKAPSAVIALLPVNETAQLVAGLRKRGSAMWVYGPSYNESRALYDAAGKESAVGVAVSQVVPNPFNPKIRLVREYQADMRAYSGSGTLLSSLSLEGYIAARLLVKALEQLGPAPTAAQVRDSLENLHQMDLGGLQASYGPSQHVALQFLDIGMVSVNGQLLY